MVTSPVTQVGQCFHVPSDAGGFFKLDGIANFYAGRKCYIFAVATLCKRARDYSPHGCIPFSKAVAGMVNLSPTRTQKAQELVEVPDDLRERQEFFQERMSAAAVRLADHVSRLDGESLVKVADKLSKASETARKSLKLDKETGNPVIQLNVLCGGPLKSLVRFSKQLPDGESD